MVAFWGLLLSGSRAANQRSQISIFVVVELQRFKMCAGSVLLLNPTRESRLLKRRASITFFWAHFLDA